MRKKIYGFGFLMFVSFAAHASLNTQAIPFLTDVGYSSSQRGIIMASHALVAMIGQFYVGYLADKHQTIKKLVIYATITLIGFSMITYLYDAENFLLHLFLMSNTLALVRMVGNLLETWLVEVDGLYPYFGTVRSFASLGWAVASLVAGQVVLRYGYASLMWVSVAMNLLVVLASIYLEDANKVSEESISFTDIKLLFKNKQYVILILAYTTTWIVYNADNVSVTDYILSIGGTEGDVGIKWFVQALSELPLMFFSGYFLRKLKGKRMMIYGSIFLGLRFFLYAVYPSLNAVYIVSLLQMISFPFLLVSQKELFLIESPVYLRSSGQMVSVAFSGGLAAIISPVIAGYLGELLPIRSIVMGLGIFMVVPIIIILFYKPSSIIT